MDFGPLFGIKANDDSSGPVLRLGTLGVDASAGDVLYTAAGTGVLTDTGSKVAFGAWNQFALLFDFSNQTYSIFLNAMMLTTTGFESMSNRLTDVDIAALAASATRVALTVPRTSTTSLLSNVVPLCRLPPSLLCFSLA